MCTCWCHNLLLYKAYSDTFVRTKMCQKKVCISLLHTNHRFSLCLLCLLHLLLLLLWNLPLSPHLHLWHLKVITADHLNIPPIPQHLPLSCQRSAMSSLSTHHHKPALWSSSFPPGWQLRIKHLLSFLSTSLNQPQPHLSNSLTSLVLPPPTQLPIVLSVKVSKLYIIAGLTTIS